jgi:formate C-acetyltransferase
MSYRFDREKYFDEFEEVFSKYPLNVDEQLREYDEMYDASKTPFENKAVLNRLIAEEAPIRIFRTAPLFFELDTGRNRNSVTSTWPPEPGLADALMSRNTSLLERFNNTWLPVFTETNIINGVMFSDTAHHYANVEKILKIGLSGIRKEILAELERDDLNDREKAFLDSELVCVDSVIHIAGRFREELAELLEKEEEPDFRENLRLQYEVSKKVPVLPPETFIEALEVFTFVREICDAVEGIGFAVLGHIDRILIDYYRKDIENNRITREEAQELIDAFLAITDARWDLEQELPGGTNASLVIGGCTRDGEPVYNEITEMVIDGMLRYRFVNPKIQARLSRKHPREYVEKLGLLAQSGINCLSVFNDEVVIDSQVKSGKEREDALLYLAGGCQEITLSNEYNSRAYVYINTPGLFNISLFPDKWTKVFEKAGEKVYFREAYKRKTFEEFYRDAIYNFTFAIQVFVNRFNDFNSELTETNPCLFYSALSDTCIERKLDVTEGGLKYNSDSFGMCGIGTVVDSLYAIKKAVYDDRHVSMQELRHAVDTDFEDNELLRYYLRNRIPKMGEDDDEVRSFASRVFRDISRALTGYPNVRGGYFEASLFSFYSYEWFRNFDATADGRRKGEVLTRGINPSELAGSIDAATLLSSQENIDYTEYPGGGVLYMDIPVAKAKIGTGIFCSIIEEFLDKKAFVMDFNVLDRETLLKAKKEPQKYQNISVRICGYSALFHTLSENMQDEIIARTQR